MQLSFAVIPLILFTNNKEKMGSFVNGRLLKYTAWIAATIILVLNLYLLYDTFFK
jgi:manganese transport protein